MHPYKKVSHLPEISWKFDPITLKRMADDSVNWDLFPSDIKLRQQAVKATEVMVEFTQKGNWYPHSLEFFMALCDKYDGDVGATLAVYGQLVQLDIHGDKAARDEGMLQLRQLEGQQSVTFVLLREDWIRALYEVKA